MANYLLNTPVLTDYGVYRFDKIEIDQAREMAKGAVSAVGHQGAAEALSKILETDIQESRQKVTMQAGDSALVFKILDRLPEGAVLSAEETLNMPYEFGRLERIA